MTQDDSQRDIERGQILAKLVEFTGRFERLEHKFDTMDTKINSLCLDSSKRQRECWEELHRQLVGRGEFVPVQRIVYGTITLICIAVASGLLTLVVRAS
jgi:thiosulfate reductase cytochrome b subunit